MGKYDEEQKMLRDMSRWLNKPEEEVLREVIRTSYKAHKIAIPIWKKLKDKEDDKQ